MVNIKRKSSDSSLCLDHLVIAAESLQAGIDHIQDLLQVPLEKGGQHQKMGTHNALLSLGNSSYLEVIAIDPSLPAPQRNRWFGLDQSEIRKQITRRPRLLHWVARTEDFTSVSFKLPASLGRIINMSRAELQWKITVPDDGSLPANGILPSLIEWSSQYHPASLLPDRGCRLDSLEATLPNADSVRSQIETMGLQEFIEIFPGPSPRLRAKIKTPAGLLIVE